MRALIETCVPLPYTSVDVAAQHILELGKVTLLAKLDIQSAYRHIPVHPFDRHFLGIRWQGKVYLYHALPFGLRSAPKIFSAVADALLWIMLNRGVCSSIHYLDDYLFFGRPDGMQCDRDLTIALNTCSELGFPVALAWHKLEGQSTRIQFLGLELDSDHGLIKLSVGKLCRIQAQVRRWLSRRSCTKRELLSLIGFLHHTASGEAGAHFLTQTY